MKFFCEKEKLLLGLNIVQKGVSSKTTLPILEGILIETMENSIKLTSNDLEIGIECIIDANVKEQGAIVIESKMFGDIVRRLPDAEILIYLDEEGLFTIDCEGALYKLSSLDHNDFPRLPEIKANDSISIKQSIIKDMIKQTLFAASVDENRPIFTGCLLEVKENNLNMVAVDGFRLSFRNNPFEGEGKDFSAVIPGKTLNEILKILQSNEEQISINISKNQVLFEMERCKIVSRLLEGEFLNYKNAIPVEKETRIKVSKSNLLSAFERIYLITREEKKYPVKMKIENNKLNIICSSTLGNAKEDIIIETEGKDIEIGFNPKYFIDALKAIEDEEIYADFTTNMAPCVIKPIKEEKFIYMILPVRIREESV
jgi:DNA polymerase-3 subunit beta